ncbi:MAG TPA: hypothetical protein VLG69_03795 [Candidatus Andersenbacteria bacterium]|nr:hypothetical protein [Candidatus Andersenbacteria bacterium]
MIKLTYCQSACLQYAENWPVMYLSWMASNPHRNWLQRIIEEEVRPALTNNPSSHWVVVCLDGAPDRVAAKHDALRIHSFERRSFAMMQTALSHVRSVLQVEVETNFRDGIVCALACEDSVGLFLQHIRAAFQFVNANESLSWIWQFHFRAGMGNTVSDAFGGLAKAKRDELVIFSLPKDNMFIEEKTISFAN